MVALPDGSGAHCEYLVAVYHGDEILEEDEHPEGSEHEHQRRCLLSPERHIHSPIDQNTQKSRHQCGNENRHNKRSTGLPVQAIRNIGPHSIDSTMSKVKESHSAVYDHEAEGGEGVDGGGDEGVKNELFHCYTLAIINIA